jgi:LacI family transcriptional regulator
MTFETLRVALLIESSNAYARGLLAGVYDHVAASERWLTFLPEHGRGSPPLASLQAWRGDGMIARIENESIAAAVREMGLPTIDTSAARLLPDLPYVETDDTAIARLAAEHLAEIGFRNFAFCGDLRFRWSVNRRIAFEREMADRAHTIDVFELPPTLDPGGVCSENDRLGRWLASLPKPVAVFACYDNLARRVIECCHDLAIDVPEQLAVLGVDDDDLLCRLTTPALSSIIPDSRGTGRLAAELLDSVMMGRKVPGMHLLIPRGIAVRQSTDIVSVDDPIVTTAARFIRENISRGIKVEDVASATQVSRRMLEQRFARSWVRTPHEEIVRSQFRLVEDLLQNTELKLAAIARRCGFKHPEYMTAAFTKRYGQSPSEWRRLKRA